MIWKRLLPLLRTALVGSLTSLLLSASSLAAVGDPIQTFTTPGPHSTGLAFDGEYLWLADCRTDQLYQIDPRDGKVVRSLPSPGFRPMGLAWDGQHLWNVDPAEQRLYAIDPEVGEAVGVLESCSPDPRGLAWDGHYLWLVDNQEKLLLKLATSDGMMVASIPAPSLESEGLAFDGKWLWVADSRADKIYRVCPETGEVDAVIRAPGPYAWGLTWDGNHLWNVDFQQNTLHKLRLEDPVFWSSRDEKVKEIEVIQEFRNYGPDIVTNLDIYIAIPTNLSNQEMVGGITFDPQPTDILVDKWLQKVAHFHYADFPAGKCVTPTMKLRAKMYLTEYYIFPENVGSLEAVPEDIAATYLADGEKYDLRSATIEKAVKEAVGNETRPYWIARKIFRYVIDRISYKLKPLGGWNPAPTVLERGTGSCSEYTFVFVAMCRAAGLPARYAGAVSMGGEDAGFDNVFHRWAEVYLPNYGWIPWDVSGGDDSRPGAQADAIGRVGNGHLITTLGGGESEYMEYYYNLNARWSSSGKCRIHSEGYGEWVPVTKEQLEE